MPTNYLKRLTLLISLITFFFIFAHAEIKKITLAYNIDDFELVKDSDNRIVFSSQVHNITFPSDSTKATVPYVSVSVLMPINAKYEGFSVNTQTAKVMEEVNLPPLPITSVGFPEENVTFPSEILNTNITSDTDVVQYTGNDSYRGYNIFHFLVRPFNFSNRSISINEEIELNINYLIEEKTDLPLSRRDVNLNHLVINPEDVVTYYGTLKIKNQSAKTNDDLLQYAIITKREFSDAFKPLVNWKNMKGIKTEMFFIDNIYSQFPNEKTEQMKLKRFIEKLYKERDVIYVLLGGDSIAIPAQVIYTECSVPTTHRLLKRHIPSDLFYASLSAPLNWDGNNNGIVGEVDDGIHFMPSVNISRIPASNVTDVENIVDKIIAYERFPVSKYWKNDIVMTGLDMFPSDFAGNYSSSIELKNALIYDEYVKPYWDGRLFNLYSHSCDCNEEWRGNYFGHLLLEISRGHSFLNIMTHGTPNSLRDEDSDLDLLGEEVSELKNISPTIITSGACHICDFTDEDNVARSFGSEILLSPTDNIVALYGCTRESLYHLSIWEPLTDGIPKYIGNFYKQMFNSHNNENHIGEIYSKSKMEFIPNCNNYSSWWWNMLSINMFGDPEMPVYTTVPKEFGNLSIKITPQGDKYEVTLKSSVKDYFVGVTKHENDNYNIIESFFQSDTDTAKFSTDNQTVNICITKDGYIPYVIVFNPECLYLQNEEFSDGCVFISPTIKLGANVTQSKECGNVVFKGDSRGKYVLRGKNIKIEAGTVFEPGAQVKMDYTSF